MRLLQLTIQGFMTYGRAPQTLSLANAGLTLIEGRNLDDETVDDNGAGKSGIHDALLWCLYGVTSHEPTKEGDQVVNRFVGKDCVVQVEFEAAAHRYVVTRGRRVTSKRWRSLFGHKPNGLYVVRHEAEPVNLTKGTTKDTQAVINRVVGMSASTFRHAVIFGQSRAYRFGKLSDAEKKAVLDEMVGAEMYARAGQVAGERLRAAEASLDIVEREVASLKSEILACEERMADLRTKQRRAWKEHAAELREAKEHALAALRTLQDAQGALEKLADAPEVHRRAKALVEAARASYESARDALTDAATVRGKRQAKIDDLDRRIDDLGKLDGETCPTCEQEVGHAHVAGAVKRLHVVRDGEAVLARVAEKQWKGATKRARDAVAALTTAKRRVEDAEKVVDAYRRAERERDVAASTAKAAKRELDRLKAAKKRTDYDALIAKEQERCDAKRDNLKARRKERTRLHGEVKQLAFWQEGFSTRGLRSLMLDAVLPYLNQKLQQYSAAITGGNIAVQLRTQRALKSGKKREELHIAVDNAHGDDTYAGLSIGERAKVDVIVGLALQDMAASRSRVPVNVAFFDEPFDGLDATAITHVMELLVETLKRRESVFVITHEPALKAYIARSIRVVKSGHASCIESS